MDSIPAEEDVEVLLELPSVAWSRRTPGEGLDRDYQLVEGVGAAPAQAFFVARAGTFSVLPIRSMYFC